MNSRGLTVAVAFLLAATATLAVYLYVGGLEKSATTNAAIDVVVSDRDIPAGTDLDELIEDGAFSTISVPEDNLVEGAVTELAQLKEQETGVPVLAGEQISTARLQGSGDLPGGTLGIPDGYEAVSVALQIPRAAGGDVAEGDHVAIYASFDKSTAGRPTTVRLVRDVEILAVAGVSSQSEATRTSTNEGVVTLALRPEDAQKLVFAQENGTLYLGLLPPGQAGSKSKPVTIFQVLR